MRFPAARSGKCARFWSSLPHSCNGLMPRLAAAPGVANTLAVIAEGQAHQHQIYLRATLPTVLLCDRETERPRSAMAQSPSLAAGSAGAPR